MKFHITSRHYDMTPEIKAFAEERVLKLKRYFEQIIDVSVILSTEKHRNAAEVTLHTNGQNLVGTSEAPDMRVAIDGAVERIETQLRKHKERLSDRKGRTHLGEAMAAEVDAVPGGVEIEDDAEE
jgi:putative sigma-54 modulation protein